MDFKKIFDLMIERNVSDMFIRSNSNLRGRINGEVEVLIDKVLAVQDVVKIVNDMTDSRAKDKLNEAKACEFTYWYKENWRFRVGVFYQRNTPALVVRKIDLSIPDFESLNLPSKVLSKFAGDRRGIVLLTGITGSGKSTAIASMIEYINRNYKRHILTVEEPIEFTFADKVSIINQRELGEDVNTYADALRQFALHSPDVLFIGNIRDKETCYAALTAAETGVLVFSTLHTVNAFSTIERIINFFPPHQHGLIMNQLSFLLKGVISLRLLPKKGRVGLVPACETMVLSPSISRLIREDKIWEIPKYIAKGDVYGMETFQQCLIRLVEENKIDAQSALEYADKREELEMELRNKSLL
ncbi:MAG: PilT/PilU family type 4a pilus ATPase [Candidatus Omnitrophica bacterium]|nr:PilT/PilU family type 4a pilus ATPase [Candidatus Omnitrophota bacterium]MDD5081520.1 PilT/PilU family type 4a pilus ATPase [Candidatus Omnitrophota bacterium]